MAQAEATKVTFGSPVGYADKFWQIGSLVPPKTCLCCGLDIDGVHRELKGPYVNGPYRYVCSGCWALPFLYFPDKKLASCGQCWIPPERFRHEHHPATAPRGARIGLAEENRRREGSSGRGRYDPKNTRRARKPTKPRSTPPLRFLRPQLKSL